MSKETINTLENIIRAKLLENFASECQDIKDEQTLDTKITELKNKINNINQAKQETFYALHKDIALKTLDEFKNTKIIEIRTAKLTNVFESLVQHYEKKHKTRKLKKPEKLKKIEKLEKPQTDIQDPQLTPHTNTQKLTPAELALQRFKHYFQEFYVFYTDTRPTTVRARKLSTKKDIDQNIDDFITINYEDIQTILNNKTTEKELRVYLNDLPQLVKNFIKNKALLSRIFSKYIKTENRQNTTKKPF